MALASAALAEDAAPERPSDASRLAVSDARTVATGRNATVAVDHRTGAVYLAWAKEVADAAAPAAVSGKTADPQLEARLARSTDGGRSFGPSVVVSTPEQRVKSHTVSPTRAAVGPGGDVYVLYNSEAADGSFVGMRSRNILTLARSSDEGRSFAAPVELASEAVEGAIGSPGMINLFAAPDGALYASWLDYRETIDYMRTHQKMPPKTENIATQLRVARSGDGGRSFARSVLASKPVCGCCGTFAAQGEGGPVYAGTRGAWSELKGSVDAVRDIVVATSRDQGGSWSSAVKVHDDGFKISGCPDVSPGVAVDGKGRLHVAWYTGSERHPGVFYAVSSDEGRSFSEPIALLTDDWLPYADVKLALDSKDNAWVAFEDRRGDVDLVRLARIGADGSLAFAEPWPGTIPDLAALGDAVVVASGALAPEGEEKKSAGIEIRIAHPPAPEPKASGSRS
ncbi:cytochrome C biosynthesis protein [Methylosinus sp. 3S-1]|nr:cytochrome C biosynthesis protein [Methylosinus sp. 3S-1]